MKLTKRQLENLIRETRRELNESPLDAVDQAAEQYFNPDGMYELESIVSSLYDDAVESAIMTDGLTLAEASTLVNMAIRKIVERSLQDAKGNFRR